MSKRSLGTSLVVMLGLTMAWMPAFADSQARIVRLSNVEGAVVVDRNSGQGYENAFLNMPIVQGMKVATKDDGRAEIEFEDGSTVRIGPKSTLEFSALGLRDSGARYSTVIVEVGLAYVNYTGKHQGDEFTVLFQNETVHPKAAAHFRVDVQPTQVVLASFNGDLQVEGPSGNVDVEKNRSAIFDLAENNKFTVSKEVEDLPLDAWDKSQTKYEQAYANKGSNNNYPYSYGVSDLNYYGNYYNVPGYGTMWQPYFTGVGWDPFMDGAWGFYPGFGYMFASAYPWGWMPYRYGSWMFIPGYGWGWQPGGWNTWQSVPVYRPTTLTHVTPLVAPTAGTTKTVLVGKAATITSFMGSHYTVHAGSAGLGIPRGSIGNLNHLNQQVTKTGFVQVHPAPQFAASSPSRSFSGFSEPHSSAASSSMGRISSGSSGHASGGGGGSHK